MSKYSIKLEPIKPQHLTECANLFVSVFNGNSKKLSID